MKAEKSNPKYEQNCNSISMTKMYKTGKSTKVFDFCCTLVLKVKKVLIDPDQTTFIIYSIQH